MLAHSLDSHSPRWACARWLSRWPRPTPHRAVRRLLEGSGRLPAEHLRYADRTDAVGARQPAGQRRSHRVGAGRQGRRRAARGEAPSLSKLPAPALGDHGAVGQGRSDRCVEGRRPRGGGRRPRAGHRRQLHLRRSCQRRRRAGTRSTSSRSRRTPSGSRRCRSARSRRMFEGNQGFDERELRSLVYKTSRGEDRYIMIRNAGTNTIGRMETHRIDPNTCQSISKSETTDFHAQSHEFFLWHDPANPNRVLVYMAIWTGGLPDPEHPGLKVPDLIAMAVTDEETGEVLARPRVLAGFYAAGSRRPADRREARRDRTLRRRPLPGFQRSQEPLGSARKFSEPAAEPAPLDVGDRRWRAGVRGGDDGGVLHPGHRSDRPSQGRRACRRHRGLQHALHHRLGRRRHRRLEASRAGQRLHAHGREQRSRD